MDEIKDFLLSLRNCTVESHDRKKIVVILNSDLQKETVFLGGNAKSISLFEFMNQYDIDTIIPVGAA